MADSRDRSALRPPVGEAGARLGGLTHARLNPVFEQFGVPQVPEDAGTKGERIDLSFRQVLAELPQVARRLLEQSHVDVSPSIRYQLEDLLWEEDTPAEIPKKARRELARALDLPELARHHDRFLRLLDRFWITEEPGNAFVALLSGTRPVTLRDRIERHVFRNPGDWSAEDLFENLGVPYGERTCSLSDGGTTWWPQRSASRSPCCGAPNPTRPGPHRRPVTGRDSE